MPPVKKASIPEAKPIRVKQDKLFYYVEAGSSRVEVQFQLTQLGDFDARQVNHHTGALVLFVSEDGAKFQLYHRFNNTAKWLLDMNVGLLPSAIAAMSENQRSKLRVYVAIVPRLMAKPSMAKFIFYLKCQMAGDEFDRVFNPNERAKGIYLFRHKPTNKYFVWTSIKNSTQVLQERLKLLQSHALSRCNTTVPELRRFCKDNLNFLVKDCFELVVSDTCMVSDDAKKKAQDLVRRAKVRSGDLLSGLTI